MSGLRVEGEGTAIVTMTLDRPERLNALTTELVDALRAAFERLAAKPPRVVILTGAGRAFCAGADLRDAQMDDGDTGARTAANMKEHYNPMVLAYHRLPCPVIARVNGVAAGGGASLALLADIVVAAKSATFIQVFSPQLALVPDLGSTWLLPRLVGRARARGLALLGDRIDAATAAAWGMIWQAVDDAELDATVQALAARLAAGPTTAFVTAGRLMDEAPFNTLEEQLEGERLAQGKLAGEPHFKAAVQAFREKRKPVFE